MPSTSNSVASSGGEAMTMPRSSASTLDTKSMVFFALLAGCTVNVWSYLFLK